MSQEVCSLYTLSRCLDICSAVWLCLILSGSNLKPCHTCCALSSFFTCFVLQEVFKACLEFQLCLIHSVMAEHDAYRCLHESQSTANFVHAGWCATCHPPYLQLPSALPHNVCWHAGGLLDYDAVNDMLDTDAIGALGVDVQWQEPWDPQHYITNHPK